ncbi:hypothetical protein [Streptomyces europaeiscabiei]|uniref:hypothetical protein n=1 Tax=Streptomyces europaeiscabiei TaxID=146819 RepID=UPI0029BECAF2|nr:hypothetical protein [Streptomyces europaeiscabiei]MDX3694740.1 hypothetical protein [Streptomyces europaeiscabiei]
MPLALLDVVVTLLVPFLTGLAITLPGRGGITAFATATQPLEQLQDLQATSRRLRPLRLTVLLLPFLWQVLVGTYLLAERLFGVLVVVGLGMLVGTCARGVVRRFQAARTPR